MAHKPREILERDVLTRVTVMRLLAEGVQQTKIAQRFGCTQGAVARFNQRHVEQIQQIREDLENEFAGLVYAEKANRLAEYEQDVQTSNAEIDNALNGRLSAEVVTEDGVTEVMQDVSDTVARLLRGKHRALRSIAEELGQLPTKMIVQTDNSAKVHHIVEGVDITKVMGLGNQDATG